MDVPNFQPDERVEDVGDLDEIEMAGLKGFDTNNNSDINATQQYGDTVGDFSAQQFGDDNFATQQYGDAANQNVDFSMIEESENIATEEHEFSNEQDISFEETVSTENQDTSPLLQEDIDPQEMLEESEDVANPETDYIADESNEMEQPDDSITEDLHDEALLAEDAETATAENQENENDDESYPLNASEEDLQARYNTPEEEVTEEVYEPAGDGTDLEESYEVDDENQLDAKPEEEEIAEELEESYEEVYDPDESYNVDGDDNEPHAQPENAEAAEQLEESYEEVYDPDNPQQQEEVVEEDQEEVMQQENIENGFYKTGEENDEVIQHEHQDVEVNDSTSNSYEEESESAEPQTRDIANDEGIQEASMMPSLSDEAKDDLEESTEKATYEDDDNDYEDAVEVEEEEQADQEEDENIAEHESGSDNDQEEVTEDPKLNEMDDYNESGDSDANETGEVQTKDQGKPARGAASKMLDSDSEEDEEKEGDLIADIFGKSDDEDEEFTGFGGEEDAAKSMKKSLAAVISDSDEEEPDDIPKQAGADKDESSSDEGIRPSDNKSSELVYDFDIMLQKKKDEKKGRRKRDGGTFISDADDIINAMLTKMKVAAEADRDANKTKKPALSKLKMLSTVVRHLKKQDLKENFIDMGVIPAIADWLSLLPDKSLPHITIRSDLLDILHDMPPIMPETLKSSGVGRAVMMLFKHPKETRKNKDSAGRLINKWTRPIFGLNDNFKSMSRGEREQRDLEQMPQSKRRRLSSGRNAEHGEEGAPEPGQLRPGERGFVMRARVPKPSNKDYVIRPKWNVEMDDEEGTSSSMMRKRGKSRKDERLEKHLRTFAERKKNSKMQSAIGISIEGNKMPLS